MGMGRLSFILSVCALAISMSGSSIQAEEQETLENRVANLEQQLKGPKNVLNSLEWHGGVLGFYQGTKLGTLDDTQFEDVNSLGFAADLELNFSPIENGKVYLRAHAGEGQGSDDEIEEAAAVFADLNTISDDNPEDQAFDLLEAYYAHEFLDGAFVLSVGKTEPLAFLDGNSFANCEVEQFVGKAFVNNPMLDSEDEYAPLLALGWQFAEQLGLTLVLQSTSRPRLEEEAQKDEYTDVFNNPFLGIELAFSPVFGVRQGNYRVYGWTQTYEHPELASSRETEGWGVGLSLDQYLNEELGVFGRFAYSNEDVYEVPWFLSGGLNLEGIIPSRAEDNLGLGFAALLSNDDLADRDVEYQLEAYYRAELNENLAIGPHFQLVLNPGGNENSDEIVGGMLRASASF